ncbi:DUF2490 domain-containing protein [Aquimarina sediminis]|uniref:DUF2490 domain-containing protein n=1 Tax=Aquimarina sediminis TaxID=2070536 RepID=UPI000CA06200|nr:DUF2490 domain-containing protein [Aquimarina sediminis]
MKKIAYLLLYVPLFSFSQDSDNQHYSVWNSLIVDYHLNDELYVKNEAHIRRTDFVSNWQQILIRPSIHYRPFEAVDFSVGYSFAKNFRTIKKINENNVWQQVSFLNHLGKSKFDHRFRFEERFIEQPFPLSSDSATKFATWFRYRFTWKIVLLKVTEIKKISFIAFDEIWLNTEKGIVPRAVNQNWFYTGIAYPIIKNGSLGIGVMSDYTPLENNTSITNSIMQTTLKYHIN